MDRIGLENLHQELLADARALQDAARAARERMPQKFNGSSDLILLKLLALRPRDLLDVADILFTQGQLEEAYLRHWAVDLEIRDRLTEALSP